MNTAQIAIVLIMLTWLFVALVRFLRAIRRIEALVRQQEEERRRSESPTPEFYPDGRRRTPKPPAPKPQEIDRGW